MYEGRFILLFQERPSLLLIMKKLRWQLLIVVVSLIAIGILLIAQQPASLPGVQPVIEPLTGGVYSEALIGSIGRLNPLLDYYNSVDQDIDRLLFSSLIKYDNQGIPHGDLAENWGISQDGTVYNFSINRDAIWHDGQPVTSDDIIFTIDMIQEKGMPFPEDLQSFWKHVEVKALDEKTLQFHLPEPFAPFMDYLTFGIVPKHIFEGLTVDELIMSDWNLSPIGSGPYKFDELIVDNGEIKGVKISLFQDYFADKPYIEEIEFNYFPNTKTAWDNYETGELMGISKIDSQIFDSALRNQDLSLYTARTAIMNFVLLNLGDESLPFFKNPEVRKALLMGINRRKIIDKVLKGQAILLNGPIFPGNWAYYEGISPVEYDTEKAVEILKSEGYTIPAEGGNVRSDEDGNKMSFEIVYPDVEIYKSIAETIQADWLKIGVQVNLKPVTFDSLLEDYLEPRSYQAALVDIDLSRAPDPDPYPFWHQTQISGGQNYSGWDDRQASEYLEQARVTVNTDERMKLYRNFQVRFDEEMPALPLYVPVYSYGVGSEVQGVSIGPIYLPSDRFNNIASWFLVSTVTTQGETSGTATVTP